MFKKQIIIMLLASVSLINLSFLSYAQELIKVNKALRQIFRQADNFEQHNVTLSEELQATIAKEADITFGEQHLPHLVQYLAQKDGQMIGYAYEDTVMGKWGPIHYLVGLNLDGSVNRAIILGYDEIRGKPVAKKRFLRQYSKKTIKHPVRLRRDINGISGATISSRSLTDGVRKILHIHYELINLRTTD